MPRGPKPKPVAQRLDLEISDQPWPDLKSACIPGPRLIHHDGQMRPTRRVLLEELHDTPIHPSHKVSATCDNPLCVNPHHAHVRQINRKDGTPVEPLPVWARGQEANAGLAAYDAALLDEASIEIERLATQIAAIPNFESMSADDIADVLTEASFADILEAMPIARLSVDPDTSE